MCGFLFKVGLTYLSLNRSATSLSGGEGQRYSFGNTNRFLFTAAYFIFLDEPSIGLHQRDNDRLIETLKTLRDQGNTVVVVEHDTDTMQQADHISIWGLLPAYSGQVTAVGTPEALSKNPNSLSGAYLAGRMRIEMPKKLRTTKHHVTLSHLKKNNLKDIQYKHPAQCVLRHIRRFRLGQKYTYHARTGTCRQTNP